MNFKTPLSASRTVIRDLPCLSSFRTLIRNLLKWAANLVLIFSSLVYVNLAQAENEVLLIERPWLREAPPGVTSLAAYMSITNSSESTVTILGVSSTIAQRTELHEMVMENDLMQMREMPELVLAPDETIELKPKGYHVMFMGVEESFQEGDEVEIEFELNELPSVKVRVPVKKDS